MTAINIDRRETEAELAHLDHVLTDEELARVAIPVQNRNRMACSKCNELLDLVVKKKIISDE